jgi:MFS family permease
VTRVVVESVLNQAEVAARLRPRDDVVIEHEVAPGRFGCTVGPFSHYERTVESSPEADGLARVVEITDYRLAAGVWSVLFDQGYRRTLRTRHAAGHSPWWAPPDVIDQRAAMVLSLICSLAVLAGYFGTIITQTITYVADEFGASNTAQGTTLAAVRIGVLLSMAMSALADRRGRRIALMSSAIGASVASALSAAAPSLAVYGVIQVAARGFSTATVVLLAIVAAEEMPAGARAYAISLLSMAGALGAGLCIGLLFLADLGTSAWRILYVVPLLFLPALRGIGRKLPESQRFAHSHAQVGMAGHGRRFWLLAVSGFLVALFTTPASQFMNEFLRDEHDYSGLRISLFTILTNTPGALGIIIGGHLADVRGRRIVGAVGMAGGTIFTVLMFLANGGASLWAFSVLGAVIGAVTIPAIGVYGPELFPTSLRGKVVAGRLADHFDRFGPAFTLLAIGPLIMAGLVLAAYPETAHRELEDINPEDQVTGPQPERR